MRYLFGFLIGLAVAITCELLILVVIDFIRNWFDTNTNRIRIKKVKTGNKYFHLRTIDDVKGITSFPEVRGQIITFREITQTFVATILRYQLDDYYVMQKRLQTDIDIFCKNLNQFGTFLQTIEYDSLDKKMAIITSANEAAKELIEQNRPIVTYFINLTKDLDEIARQRI